MAIPTDVVLLGLYDAKVSPMSTDTGSAPTYGTAVDCPGVSTLSIAPTMDAKTLKGDGGILASYSAIIGGTVEFTIAKLALALLPTLQGGAVTATGTTPNQKQTYSLVKSNAANSYFKIEGAWNPAEAGYGDVHVVAYKVKVTEPPTVQVNDANGDYGTVTIKGNLVWTNSTDPKLLDIVVNETVTAIS